MYQHHNGYDYRYTFIYPVKLKISNKNNTQAKLNMFGKNLHDKMFPEEFIINKDRNTNTCVIDYLLMTVCHKFPKYIGFNRPSLEKYFKDDTSPEKLIKWVKNCGKRVSIYIMDSYNKVMLKHHPDSDHIDYALVKSS
jgi:hypothetical protein